MSEFNPYWTALVKRLDPYVPGEQPRGEQLIKLNTNENPYGPSPRVIEALGNALSDKLRLYPDSQSLVLREAIAEHNGVQPENVFVGNGSDEVLALAFLAFFSDGGTLQFPDISYSFYPVYCKLFGINSRLVPLQANMSLSLDDFTSDGSVIFPNPNAPTSLAVDRESVSRMLQRISDSVVLVDEAYTDFGGESAVTLIGQFPNLLITQTFSKSRSLAGLRVGFALADAGLIQALERVKDSFNSYPLDTLAQVAATAAMQDVAYFDQICSRVIATRESAARGLSQMGFEVLDSSANFLFVSHPQLDGKQLHQSLRSAGILTRHWDHARIAQYIRITIGTEQDMKACIDAMQRIVVAG